MPTNDGRFRGQGWSQAKEDAWTRIFGPALADDPAYEDAPKVPDLMAELEESLRRLGCGVPAEPPDEVSVGEHAARLYDDLAVEELQREIEDLQ